MYQGRQDRLEDKVKEPYHQPLDPNALPNRAPKNQERAPRRNKEEFSGLIKKPILLAFNGNLSTLNLSLVGSNVPTPEDLAETSEVQFTQEIQDLAAQLEHNPVRI